MKDYKYHYVYKTTNLINQKFYVGRHSSNKNPEKDNYLGSGEVFSQSFRKNGRKNFKREILEFCRDFEILCKREEFWIKELKAVELGYNLTERSTGAKSGEKNHMYGKTPWNKGKTGIYSDKTLEKMRVFRVGKKQSEESIDKMLRTREERDLFKHTEESKKRLKKSWSKNRDILRCLYCGFESKMKPIMIQWHFDNCKQNPNYVKPLKREHKIPKLTCLHCGLEGSSNNMKRWHFDNCKFKK